MHVVFINNSALILIHHAPMEFPGSLNVNLCLIEERHEIYAHLMVSLSMAIADTHSIHSDRLSVENETLNSKPRFAPF